MSAFPGPLSAKIRELMAMHPFASIYETPSVEVEWRKEGENKRNMSKYLR